MGQISIFYVSLTKATDLMYMHSRKTHAFFLVSVVLLGTFFGRASSKSEFIVKTVADLSTTDGSNYDNQVNKPRTLKNDDAESELVKGTKGGDPKKSGDGDAASSLVFLLFDVCLVF